VNRPWKWNNVWEGLLLQCYWAFPVHGAKSALHHQWLQASVFLLAWEHLVLAGLWKFVCLLDVKWNSLLFYLFLQSFMRLRVHSLVLTICLFCPLHCFSYLFPFFKNYCGVKTTAAYWILEIKKINPKKSSLSHSFSLFFFFVFLFFIFLLLFICASLSWTTPPNMARKVYIDL
jgi:hypothetical protein